VKIGEKYPIPAIKCSFRPVFANFREGYMCSEISIHINGEDRSVRAGTLMELVTEMGLEKRMIAIECNLEVIPKSQYEETALKEGDRIELVHMIGGG